MRDEAEAVVSVHLRDPHVRHCSSSLISLFLLQLRGQGGFVR